MTAPGSEYEIRTHASIRDVGEAEYRSLVGDETPPFLHFEWLDALETSGAVRVETGWLPQLITLHRRGAEGTSRLVAVAPAYVKGNSEGEFVFDHSWASFAENQLHSSYYPKLILAVPFTPATAQKLIVHPEEDASLAHRVLCQALPGLARELGLSSAHVLFPPAEEAETFGSFGLARRFGVQFHWENRGYGSYEDFLASFGAKRRAALRRER
jgi:predicted N-acyltransferase